MIIGKQYKIKNKLYRRHCRKATLQIILTGEVRNELFNQIVSSVNCANCKYYNSDTVVLNRNISACHKAGIIQLAIFNLLVMKNADGDTGWSVVKYCRQFKEKKLNSY